LILDYAIQFVLHDIFLQVQNNFDIYVLITDWFFNETSNASVIIGALFMGTIGSTAYLVASKLGFIKFNKNKNFENLGYLKASGYALVGGAVAIVFQIPELPNFIPIQSFVLGITWPLLVAQYTSKTEPSRGKEEVKKELSWDES